MRVEMREVVNGFCRHSRQRVKPVVSEVRLCGFKDAQQGHGSAEEEQSAASGGTMLVVAGAEAEEVAELIVASAEPGG